MMLELEDNLYKIELLQNAIDFEASKYTWVIAIYIISKDKNEHVKFKRDVLEHKLLMIQRGFEVNCDEEELPYFASPVLCTQYTLKLKESF